MTTDQMPLLPPCACGGQPNLATHFGLYRVECLSCRTGTEPFTSAVKAQHAWLLGVYPLPEPAIGPVIYAGDSEPDDVTTASKLDREAKTSTIPGTTPGYLRFRWDSNGNSTVQSDAAPSLSPTPPTGPLSAPPDPRPLADRAHDAEATQRRQANHWLGLSGNGADTRQGFASLANLCLQAADVIRDLSAHMVDPEVHQAEISALNCRIRDREAAAYSYPASMLEFFRAIVSIVLPAHDAKFVSYDDALAALRSVAQEAADLPAYRGHVGELKELLASYRSEIADLNGKLATYRSAKPAVTTEDLADLKGHIDALQRFNRQAMGALRGGGPTIPDAAYDILFTYDTLSTQQLVTRLTDAGHVLPEGPHLTILDTMLIRDDRFASTPHGWTLATVRHP